MPNLLLKFQVRLESPPIKTGMMYVSGLYGPQFHRWLPDGEKDAISLDTGNPNATLKIWFERCGFVDGNIIKFDYERQEVDPEIMSTQGKLDAGPLKGLLNILDISDEEVNFLKEKKVDDKRYLAFEKKIIKLFYTPVIKFIEILRTQYGQYWIPEIEKWDSRRESASSYLRRFGFPRCSFDGGNTWDVFASTSVKLSVNALRKHQDFREYLTKVDWQEIPKLISNAKEPSQAAFVITEAIELFDRGYIRYAIIDAVTALEIALSESFRSQLTKASDISFNIEDLPFYVQIAVAASIDNDKPYSSKLDKAITIFNNSKLPEKFMIMATLLKIPQQYRNDTHKIIDLRNDIVHDSKTPPENIESEFSGFLQAFALILSHQSLRFPMAHSGNRLLTQEDWEQFDG